MILRNCKRKVIPPAPEMYPYSYYQPPGIQYMYSQLQIYVPIYVPIMMQPQMHPNYGTQQFTGDTLIGYIKFFDNA
jgi:hypothetical protein